MTTKVQATKTINRVKRQSTKWKKILANHIYDKELVLKIY